MPSTESPRATAGGPAVTTRLGLAILVDQIDNKALRMTLVCLAGAIVQRVLYGSSWSAFTLGAWAVVACMALLILGPVVRRDKRFMADASVRDAGTETVCIIIVGAFAAYLVLYRGLWRSWPLLAHQGPATAPGVLVHAVLIYCGIVLWHSLAKLCLISTELDKGKIVIGPAEPGP